MADSGFGTTITFSSGFFAEILSVDGPDLSRDPTSSRASWSNSSRMSPGWPARLAGLSTALRYLTVGIVSLPVRPW